MENQFNVGDLVWAKVHGHPWWPSIVYHEALTSTQAQQAKKEGCVLVSFFGDYSYKWLDPKKLLHFESNYNVNSNQSSSRLFVKAVKEAVYEVNYRAALGLTCPCKFFASYQPTPVEGLQEVDLDGYKSGGVFTVQQIERFRQEFRPVETLSFVQQLALDPTDVPQDLNHSKEVARILAFRKAKYEQVDEPYFLAFGVNPKRPGDPIVASNSQEIALVHDPTGHPYEAERTPKIKCQNKNKRCLAPQKDKPHAAKVKRRDSNSKSSQDHVPQKRRRPKLEVERKLDFTSANDDEKESSPSPPKEPSMSKDHKEVKPFTTTTKCDDVHFVEEVQSSGTPVHDVHFVEKVKSSETSVPSKTQHTHEDSPAVSKPLKKRQRTGEGRRILSIKFPPDTALPSASELEVKFARFGPIETSGIRVNWVKSRCWVVFVNKSDAKKAYRRACKSKETFGQTKVTYRLRPKVSTPDLHEGGLSGANADMDLQQEETQVTPSHAPVTSCLHPQFSTPGLLEGGISGANADSNPQQEEIHAPVTSRSTYLFRIGSLSQEIHARYREQVDQTPVKVNQGNVDISEKFLSLLNECYCLVLESKHM